MKLFKNSFSSKSSENTIGKELFSALYESNKKKVIELIETNNIDINSYSDFSNPSSILIQSLHCQSQYQDSKEQIDIVKYLIDNDADINWLNNDGFNALHISLVYHNLSKTSLILIKSNKVDINTSEKKNGNNPIFTAIREYGKTWREEQKELNQLRFEIIEELLKRGADMDMMNNHGITSRRWVEISKDEKLHSLINKYSQK
ncbi:ankyrin repeat domain-containing protein [Cellulophaga sp. HaHa_2_95]|uniref:ankyrin repeat domain-containing protein n=1 Tax=Cellulophaga sp. HaHa_2_95 TaxID=2745558 RepID=UPI001C4F2F91|nr:ankyrin repeat domain-containing protein [Cellulophaga sp. HaHa_2_95]QXP57290.1 ankyrin repeat domain-containing protein [Cellulophaga sp. HaHa_2_95]